MAKENKGSVKQVNAVAKTNTTGALPGIYRFISEHPYLLIVIAGLLVYARTLSFAYSGVDEYQLIDLNTKDGFLALFSKGIFANFHEANRQIGGDYYRPMLSASFKLESYLPGDKCAVAHAGNLFYHLLASCLLLAFLIKLKIRDNAAFCFAILFTVHPVLTQAVAWIPGRNDSLLAVLTLSSLLFFLDFAETKKWWTYLLYNLFFFMAMLTKETAIVIPLITIALQTWWLKQPVITKPFLLRQLGWIPSVILWYLLRKAAIGGQIDAAPAEMASAFMSRLPVVLQYLGKIIFPFNLSVYPTVKDTTVLWGLLALAVLGLVMYQGKKDWQKVALGAFWFFIFLLPVLLLPERINSNLFEHRLYLPLIGMFIVINESFIFKPPVVVSQMFAPVSAAIVAVFAVIAFVHSGTFADKYVFWQNAAETSPGSSGAQYVFGVQCYDHKDTVAAEQYLKKALELNPKETKANYVLGTLYKVQKRFPEAIHYLSIETTLDPKSDSAAFSLAYSLYATGNVKEAEQWYLKTLQINNNYLDAYQSLAIICDQQLHDYARALNYANELQRRGGQVPKEFFETLNRELGNAK